MNRAVWAVVGAKVAITLATASRYGFHRDELYYVVAGRRLSMGYVDFPPVTPVLARGTDVLFGSSLVALRLPALLAGVATVLLTVGMARRLGGSPRAQWLAALAITCTSFFLGASGLMQTVSFDILAWALALYCFVSLVVTGDARWWVAIGAALGLGMLTKYTTPALAAGLVAATLTSPNLRTQLRTRWPWLGTAAALLIASPNLIWQVANGWPSIDFLRGQNARVRSENSPVDYVVEQLAVLGPVVLTLCVAGARRVWRDVRLRPLVVLALAVEVTYLVARGKSYYPLDAAPLAIAAGAVAVASWARWRVLAGALVVWALVTLPLALPVLPQDTMLDLGMDEFRDDYSAELGWPRFVNAVKDGYRGLPDADRRVAFLLTRTYAQAAAVDVLGPDDLPPAHSGHNTYYEWLPDRAKLDVVLAVGFARRDLDRWFQTVEVVGHVPRDSGIDVEQRGSMIAVARTPRLDASTLWREVKLFS